MLVDNYIEYTKHYKIKYGNNTIVLMQVGSFYEFYSITDDINSDIYKIAEICNILISRKNKTINEVSIDNPLMAGFPLYVLDKYKNILLQNNYTIVIITQVTEPPNPDRKVTEILSPGMNINVNTKKNNYMMLIYLEYINNLLVAGISGIDLSTGTCFINEAGSTNYDKDYAIDELFRMITIYNPSELIILSNDTLTDELKNYILKKLIINNILVHYKWNSYEYIDIMTKIPYQKKLLEKVYNSKKSALSIFELLNIELYNMARIAFCSILEFAYQHNADTITELSLPELIENNNHLIIEYNSVVQLNLIGIQKGDKPLLDILNRCSTSFGSREFKKRLLNPIINQDILNDRYDEIDKLLKDNLYNKIEKHLNYILDLERIKRKIILNKYSPQEWYSFKISLENALEIYNILNIDKFKIIINSIINSYDKILDIDKASKYNINDIKGNIFYKGIYKDVDDTEELLNDSFNIIQNINNEICNIDKNGDTTLSKVENSERDGYYISMTKKRYENAKKLSASLMNKFKIIGTNISNYKLTSDEIITQSNIIDIKQKLLSTLVYQYYISFINEFIDNNRNNIDIIIDNLSNIDITCCCAKNANEYRYYRPKIINSDNSFINAKDIRHPIVERINDDVEYIGNDIELSADGILLYGINSSGKSCFMKNIGLNIIMAQSGMFVASKEMYFNPFRHIFTRISGADNIYKGMSSFTVEMTELRNILQRANKYSLVLGDEICNGTESTSGLAIVASAIDNLINKSACFIFASHLHELIDINIIKNLINIKKKLRIYHMHIKIENDRIIYDRKIKEGNGSSIYGIEVCKSLNMPNDFMKNAELIRKELQGLNNFIINLKKTSYNKDVLLDKCIICGNNATEIHHINYQKNSDNDGFFKNYHKNVKHNLVQLCKECHYKEHANIISIDGYSTTTDGIILNVNENVNENLNEKSIDDSTIDNDLDYDKIRKYILYGKNNTWYMRTAKTMKFKKCLDINKIIIKINKLLNTNITNISNKLYDKLYDNTI
tara:strand:+ start:10898 stop:13945 length:3048 start_codon:yes stop_codon:yes gene_type:complete